MGRMDAANSALNCASASDGSPGSSTSISHRREPALRPIGTKMSRTASLFLGIRARPLRHALASLHTQPAAHSAPLGALHLPNQPYIAHRDHSYSQHTSTQLAIRIGTRTHNPIHLFPSNFTSARNIHRLHESIVYSFQTFGAWMSSHPPQTILCRSNDAVHRLVHTEHIRSIDTKHTFRQLRNSFLGANKRGALGGPFWRRCHHLFIISQNVLFCQLNDPVDFF